MTWKIWAATNLQRYAIGLNEYVTIQAGFVMVVDTVPLLRVDGCLKLDGLLIVREV